MGEASFCNFDSLPIGTIVLDQSFNIIHWNRTMKNWTKVESNKIVGKNLFDAFSNLSTDAYKIRFEDVFKGRGPAVFSAKIHKFLIPIEIGPGKMQFQQCSFDIISETDSGYGVLSITDVTLIFDKLKKLKSLNKIKNDFLAVCTHDLRTPLNSIMGISEILLEDEYIKENYSEEVGMVEEAGKMQLSLIDEIMTITKKRNQEVYEAERLNLVKICSFSYKMNLPVSKVKDINLQMEGQEINYFIEGNKEDLIRVINNLLSNAIKFTPEGGNIKLKVISHARSLEILVADNGQGITKENQKTLFDKFNKNSTKGSLGEFGSGLGLSIVKEIVEKNGGQIFVDSEIGRGTTFKLIF